MVYAVEMWNQQEANWTRTDSIEEQPGDSFDHESLTRLLEANVRSHARINPAVWADGLTVRIVTRHNTVLQGVWRVKNGRGHLTQISYH